jgi:O-antigen/teichoic acid export membrane protein
MPTPDRDAAAARDRSEGRSGRLRRLVVDAGPLAVSRYLAAAINLVTTIAATRWLGVDGFGAASLALAYPMLLWSVTSVKSVSITTRYVSSFRIHRDRQNIAGICLLGYLLDLGIALGATLIVVGTSSLIAARVYGLPELSPLMIVLAASFPLYSLLGTNEAILTSYERFRAIALIGLLESSARLGFVLGGWLLGGGAFFYVAATAGAQALTGVVGLGAAMRTLTSELGHRWWFGTGLTDMKRFNRELWEFFGWNYILVTVSGFVDQLPAMLLGRYQGTSAVAYYRLASNLMVSVGYVEAALRRAVYPKLIAEWNTGGSLQLRRDLRAMTVRIGVPVGGAICLGALVVVPSAVRLLFGGSYQAMIPGAQLMIASAAVPAALFWRRSYYYAAGHVALWSKLYLAYGAVFVAATWFVSRTWGFLGVAVLVAAGEVVLALAAVGLARTRRFHERT